MLKSPKFFTVLGVLIVVALIGVLYLSSKNAINQDPIKIYKTSPLKTTIRVSKVNTTETKNTDAFSPIDSVHIDSVHPRPPSAISEKNLQSA